MDNTIIAKKAADTLQPLILETAENSLFEALMELNDDEASNPAEEFYTIYKLLQDITCALTNPAFSSMLYKGYQADAGRVLKNLLACFEKLYESSEIHKLVLFKWLNYFPGTVNTDKVVRTVELYMAKDKS